MLCRYYRIDCIRLHIYQRKQCFFLLDLIGSTIQPTIVQLRYPSTLVCSLVLCTAITINQPQLLDSTASKFECNWERYDNLSLDIIPKFLYSTLKSLSTCKQLHFMSCMCVMYHDVPSRRFISGSEWRKHAVELRKHVWAYHFTVDLILKVNRSFAYHTILILYNTIMPVYKQLYVGSRTSVHNIISD